MEANTETAFDPGFIYLRFDRYGMTRIAFVCVGNAARSQLATALAERTRGERDLDVEIVTGGTDPADHVHGEVIEVLREHGMEIGDRQPRRITPADIEDADHVVTMGCSIDDVRPDGWSGEVETWELSHPSGEDIETTRALRDEIELQIVDLFDRLET